MWKFPYITGKYGGAAFFLLFIVCLVLIGLPLMLAELTIGRGGRGSASSSFINLTRSKYWGFTGFLSVLTAFLIMSYYSVVSGWTLHYAIESFTGVLYRTSDFSGKFSAFASGYWPVFWQAVVMILCGGILAKGVARGIETFNKVLIPGFLVILIVLMVRSVTLPGAGKGIEFFLDPDFSKLSLQSALVALGHAFFSLSLGMGTILTYGAYVDKRQSLGTAALAIAGGDLAYALVAGLIIFPTIFSFGLEPNEGVGLAFMALPAAFSAMPWGNLFGGLFFVLLAIAALTSAVSILEVPVAFAIDRWKWSRGQASFRVSLLCFVCGLPAALSVGGILSRFTLFGKSYFDLLDFVTANILMPLGGLVVTLFTGYAWKRAGEEAGLTGFWYRAWMFLLRYAAPVLIVLIFLYSTGLFRF
jgi:NSS family neurotransmitter:Na+ symporter